MMGAICYTHYIRQDDPMRFYKEVEKAVNEMQAKGLAVDPINVAMTTASNEYGNITIFQAAFLVGRKAHE